jgi:transcriptional/translational regulatory protein YebC/TACO1
MFESKGVIMISKEEGYDEDALMEAALEAGAEDFVSDEDAYIIYTETGDLAAIASDLEAAGFKYVSAEEDKIPSTYVTLTSDDDIKYMNLLIEHLEDNDDVTEVYHNWENCD